MPNMERSMASYWNGSAWVDIVIPTTTNSALINFDIEDIIVTPMMVSLRVSNRSNDPTDNTFTDGSADAKGPYTDVFTNFIPIKVRDGDSGAILFSGIVYSTREIYDMSYGMIIEVQCKDYLTELRDNSTDGAYGYKLTNSTGTAIGQSVLNTYARDDEKKVWTTLVSSRSGLIKSLLTQTSKNITPAGDAERFVESDNRFGETGTYKLGGRNQKSVLAHIIDLSSSEPYTVSGEEVFGYDFYVDPNFTSTAADHKPTAAFNYFKRGQRPNIDFNPENYGLRIEHPSAANFTPTGKLLPMLEFDFERPRGELFTDAIVSYAAKNETEDGGTSVEERLIPFEIIQIKAASASLSTTVPRWKGLPIASGHTEYGGNDGTVFPEWLEVEVSGTWTTVARMQYISKTSHSSISATAPAFVLISEINPALSDTDAYFDEDTVWRGKDTTALTFTLLSRPRTKYGIKRTARINMASGDRPSAIREQVAASLIRRSTQIIRGSFKTYDKPQYYFDNQVTVSGTTTQTVTLGSSVNPIQQGFRVGMAVAKLDAENGDTTATYGYASAVTSTTITVTWATGYPVDDAFLRFFVPVRAGDLVYLRNNLINIAGNYLVTKIKYTEQPGISNTQYEVVGRETNKEGGYNRKSFVVAAADAVNTKPNIPQSKPNAGKASESITDLNFTSSLANQVAWGTGTYNTGTNTYPNAGTLTVGINQYAITAGTTSSTMVSAANGNTGQATDGTAGDLADDTDYYIYYSGSGTALSTIRKDVYGSVADEDTILIGHCKEDTTEAEFTIAVQEFSIPDKGSAVKKLTKESITGGLIQADSIATAHISGTLAGSKLSIDVNTTFSSGYDPVTKGKIFAQDGIPTAISVGDIWIDTNDSNKTYRAAAVGADAITGGEWVLYDFGAARATADTANTLAATKARVYREGPTPSAVQAGDVWINTANQEIKISTGTGTGNWQLRDDAAAINQGSTNIDGGLINTQKIILRTGNILKTGTTADTGGARIEMDNTHIIGYSSSGTGSPQFEIKASDGKAMFGAGGVLASEKGLILGSFGSPTGDAGNYFTNDYKRIAFSHSATGADDAAKLANALTATPKVSLGMEYITGTSGGASFAVMQWARPDYGSGTYFILQDMNRGMINNLSSLGPGDFNERNHIRLPNNMSTSSSNALHASKHPILYLQNDSGDEDGYPDTPWGLSVISQNDLIGSLELTDASLANSYGMFRYTSDGGGGTSDTLAFNAGQSDATPHIDNEESAFWTMLSESDGGSGSRLIFEPIVDYNGAKNNAWIGYHNELVGINSLWVQAGPGTESLPSLTFYGDYDTGLHNPTGDNIRVTCGARDVLIINTAIGLYPAENDQFNLGSVSYKWDTLYATNVGTSGVKITTAYIATLNATTVYATNVGTSSNKITTAYIETLTQGDLFLDNTDHEEGNMFDGTKGHWLIQEGADDLFIKNILTGKKYKFKLEEIV